MNRILVLLGIGLLLGSSAAADPESVIQPEIGELIGPVSAMVGATDNPAGLAVRSGPTAEAPVMGYLAPGTKIKALNEFVDGSVRLREPFAGGWTQIASLEPQGARAIVASVDYPEGCLRIRSGPSTSSPKVGCATLGSKLELTGIWSQNNWAQVAGPVPGWVTASQISSVIKPPGTRHVGVSVPIVTSHVIVTHPRVVATPVYPSINVPYVYPDYVYGGSYYGGYGGRRRYYGPSIGIGVGHGWGHGHYGGHGGHHH